MAYRLKRSDDSIEAAMRRIVDEQASSALTEIADTRCDPAETVHRVRKHCKQLRALVRLVRPVFPGYAEANARLRALAAPLAVVRDADVMIQTCDWLVKEDDGVDAHSAVRIRRRLCANRKALGAIVDVEARLAAAADDMKALREDAGHWSLDGDGFDAISDGVRRIYRRARKAMLRAAASGEAEDFHDWRKSAKYHWYHTRLLAPLWAEEMAVHVEAADALGELLGEHHDLTVLEHALSSHPDDFGGSEITGPFCSVLTHQAERMAQRALTDGRMLFSERPRALVARWQGYWRIWREGEPAHGQAAA